MKTKRKKSDSLYIRRNKPDHIKILDKAASLVNFENRTVTAVVVAALIKYWKLG